jgi:pyridoxine 5-phosphate synthase
VKKKLELGVNIDHVATLRQARGTVYPSIVEAAACCEAAGAEGITVHLREDRRHIQDKDVYDLKRVLNIRLNLEMAVNPEIVGIALDILPEEACIVPEKREELTTEGGLDVAGQKDEVGSVVRKLTDAGVEVSLFVDPDKEQLEASAAVGAKVVELHTGTFCDAVGGAAEVELKRLIKGAEIAHELGMVVNAGHGINLDNIDAVLTMPWMNTLNIGHSIIAHAVFVGLEQSVRDMIKKMENYNG